MALHILFVDDEPNVLNGLRRILRGMRTEWNMRFVSGGEEALQAIEQEPADVVVTDMMMPGMDGADLLQEIKRRHPQTVRIILSGHSDKDRTVKAVGATHRFLAKPCEVDELKRAISGTVALQSLLADPALQALVARMDTLPSIPSLFTAVTQELAKPHSSLEKVGQIIAMDIGMSAKILQIVNSSYFGLARPLRDVPRAVAYLGIDVINALVLSMNVFSTFENCRVDGFSVDKLWKHSVLTARRAKALAQAENPDIKVADDAFLAGMLHAAGQLLLAGNVPQEYAEALRRARSAGCPEAESEREVIGSSHAEVGAYLLSLWGLPDPIVQAVAFHLRPSSCVDGEFGPLAALHAANALGGNGDSAQQGYNALDRPYLEQMGVAGRVEAWRAICAAADDAEATA